MLSTSPNEHLFEKTSQLIYLYASLFVAKLRKEGKLLSTTIYSWLQLLSLSVLS